MKRVLSLVTALVPHIGYDRSADLAKKAYAAGKTVREIAIADKVLPEEQINELLGPPPGQLRDKGQS